MRKRLVVGVGLVLVVVFGAVFALKRGKGESKGESGSGILFVKHEDYVFAPFYLRGRGGSTARIGPSYAWARDFALSPDGKEILFDGQVYATGWGMGNNNHLYVMRSDGSGLEQLTDAGDGVEGLAWSPDSTKILYLRTTGVARNPLVVLTLRTGQERVLESAPFSAAISWGVPGIAVSGFHRIMLLDPKTHRSSLFAPIAPGTRVGRLAWSRAGQLAVLEEVDDADWLLVYSRSGRELIRSRLEASASNACGLTWSPDGERLLLVARHLPGYSVWTTGLSSGRWHKLPLSSLGNYDVSCN